jgi:uracil-DNA glycosylase
MSDSSKTAGLAAELTAALDWYREMGADEAVGEAPIDWLQRGDVAPGAGFAHLLSPRPASGTPAKSLPAPPPPRSAIAPPPTQALAASAPAHRPPSPMLSMPHASVAPATRQFPATAPEAAVTAARAAAREAATLDELGARLAVFDGCSLKATAKSLCFYRGMPKARLMLIGEAPGRDEDLEGKPFVGRAGQLLDKMLAAISLSDQNVHITNVVYWRPPGNRTPTPQEAQACRPFLERQVELVAPEVVVLLGGAAAKHLLEVADGIMRIRGKWREIEIGSAKVRAIATLHPAYLLRAPAAKRLVWRDLLAIKTALAD